MHVGTLFSLQLFFCIFYVNTRIEQAIKQWAIYLTTRPDYSNSRHNNIIRFILLLISSFSQLPKYVKIGIMLVIIISYKYILRSLTILSTKYCNRTNDIVLSKFNYFLVHTIVHINYFFIFIILDYVYWLNINRYFLNSNYSNFTHLLKGYRIKMLLFLIGKETRKIPIIFYNHDMLQMSIIIVLLIQWGL